MVPGPFHCRAAVRACSSCQYSRVSGALSGGILLRGSAPGRGSLCPAQISRLKPSVPRDGGHEGSGAQPACPTEFGPTPGGHREAEKSSGTRCARARPEPRRGARAPAFPGAGWGSGSEPGAAGQGWTRGEPGPRQGFILIRVLSSAMWDPRQGGTLGGTSLWKCGTLGRTGPSEGFYPWHCGTLGRVLSSAMWGILTRVGTLAGLDPRQGGTLGRVGV